MKKKAMSFVKIVIFVPKSHGDVLRKALAKAGAGHVGKYDFCSFTSDGIGRFRPLKGTKPFLGKIGKIGKVREERIETICPRGKVKMALDAIRKVHPYEEPAIDVFPLFAYQTT